MERPLYLVRVQDIAKGDYLPTLYVENDESSPASELLMHSELVVRDLDC